MLQQTQALRVIDRWIAWCDEYPTPADLAAASLGDVLRQWQGLGYPRRARHLHRSASLIVAEHEGIVPDDLETLLRLPGVGPYTARAVLAFAFERDVGVVDTNIARVLARVEGARLTPRAAQSTADRLVPPGRGWLWNQVVMDLGAAVCRPTPDCADCPLSGVCAWAAAGNGAPDPAVGSAGVSGRQAPFEGSNRQARGRVLRAVAEAPQPLDRFDAEVVAGLMADGLLAADGDRLTLPE